MKVLILPDGMNWVVDRNCNALVKSLPDIDFDIVPYAKTSKENFELIVNNNRFDIIHHFNADVRWLGRSLYSVKPPLLITIRSHRYTSSVHSYVNRPNTYFHVINKDLLYDFPNATYIPNGIFDHIKPRKPFIVGYAGHLALQALEYDGYYLIREACEELGPEVQFKAALKDIQPERMPDFYESLDLYICASKAEGFNTGVMEALAMNIPVISVATGTAKDYIHFPIERSVEGIKQGILKFFTQDSVSQFRWDKLADDYRKLYERILL